MQSEAEAYTFMVHSHVQKEQEEHIYSELEKVIANGNNKRNKFIRIDLNDNIALKEEIIKAGKRRVVFIMRMEESELTADKIKELSRYGLTVGVCTDNAQYFWGTYAAVRYLYDAVGVGEYESEYLFRQSGALTINCDRIASPDIAKALTRLKENKDIKEPSRRRYDFSFIGRNDRTNRSDIQMQVKRVFSNTLCIDSRKKWVSETEFEETIGQTRFLMNDTHLCTDIIEGVLKFPYSDTRQLKGRMIRYAANGCIIFSKQAFYESREKDKFGRVKLFGEVKGYEVKDWEDCGEVASKVISRLSETDINMISKETMREAKDTIRRSEKTFWEGIEYCYERRKKEGNGSSQHLSKREMKHVIKKHKEWIYLNALCSKGKRISKMRKVIIDHKYYSFRTVLFPMGRVIKNIASKTASGLIPSKKVEE